MAARFHGKQKMEAQEADRQENRALRRKARRFKKIMCPAAAGLCTLIFMLWMAMPAQGQSPPWWWNNTTAAGTEEAKYFPASLSNFSELQKGLAGFASGPDAILGGYQQELTGLFIMLIMLLICLMSRAPPDVTMLVMFLFAIVLPAASMAPLWFYGVAVVLAGYLVVKGYIWYTTGGGFS